jgi:hypothetical protein
MSKEADLFLVLALAFGLASCVQTELPLSDLFPPSVGEYLRTDGPSQDTANPDVQVALYQGPAGSVLLRLKQVGQAQIQHALSELPPLATEVGYDAALGQRDGVFFTFGNEYHAAWGNGDWVFVLSASSAEARAGFLASYGY